jgi:hypothetical protein
MGISSAQHNPEKKSDGMQPTSTMPLDWIETDGASFPWTAAGNDHQRSL